MMKKLDGSLAVMGYHSTNYAAMVPPTAVPTKKLQQYAIDIR
jgi:hypothetical protein